MLRSILLVASLFLLFAKMAIAEERKVVFALGSEGGREILVGIGTTAWSRGAKAQFQLWNSGCEVFVSPEGNAALWCGGENHSSAPVIKIEECYAIGLVRKDATPRFFEDVIKTAGETCLSLNKFRKPPVDHDAGGLLYLSCICKGEIVE